MPVTDARSLVVLMLAEHTRESVAVSRSPKEKGSVCGTCWGWRCFPGGGMLILLHVAKRGQISPHVTYFPESDEIFLLLRL